MKIFTAFFLTLFVGFGSTAKAQTICAGNGNLMLYTNYDGGIININVDVNIPNLKIGICTYEPVQVAISGAFAGNVTQVLYAGFNSTQNNNNCNQGNFITSITGVPNNLIQIQTYPPVDYQTSNGWPNIICAYACDTIGNQGGCNTVDQVVYYFTQQTGGTLYAHNIQYSCWQNTTYNVSAGGTCCIQAPGIQQPPVASFVADTTGGCTGACVNFTNTSTGGPFASTVWNFQGAAPSTSTDENPVNICYSLPGTYPVSLTVSNTAGTDSETLTGFITINNPVPTAQFTYTQIDNYNTTFTNTSTGATSYLWQFPNNQTSNLQNPDYNFPGEGTYPVTLIATGPCSSDTFTTTVTIIKIAIIGIDEYAPLKGFTIYPNPGNSAITVALAQASTNISVNVFSPIGKLVASHVNLTGQNLQIDTGNLASGTYLIRINANGKQGHIMWTKI